MSPEEFIARWRGNTRSERAAAQHHFLDLCDLLGVDKPTGGDYDFEKYTRKIGDTQGYADVWKRKRFAWEYKKDRKNLVQAYTQLKQYADALENPPLLIVSDMQEIRIHTNFTNSIAQQHVIALADLTSVESRQLLRNCFLNPERLQPTVTRESVTAQAAAAFAEIAVRLRQHYDERQVAHFINKLVFCLFAEDIEILPGRVFADVLDEGVKDPGGLEGMMRELFSAMAKGNRRFGTTLIPWFNGGLFDDEDVLPLGIAEARALRDAARLDWSVIDPTIFGTLFESGLDDKKRAEMATLFDAPEPDTTQARLFANPAANRGVGIHYTDEATIMKIIEPVVIAPLRREWKDIKSKIAEADGRRAQARSQAEKTRLLTEARSLYTDFRVRLGRYRVLDPACGSGNFLALSLRALKDFDQAVLEDAKALGLPPDDFRVGPEAMLGIEINPYAAELARLTVWITELQWQLRKGLGFKRSPILGRLDGIVRGDALMTAGGGEREWPEADVVVGNPPFLGGKRMRSLLGDAYTERLRAAFAGRLPGFSDLVCYWFEKAREMVELGRSLRAGLVATSSIRGGANRTTLDRVASHLRVYNAWDEMPWVIEGARVEVSLVCFSRPNELFLPPYQLNGHKVPQINSDLSSGSDLTKALALSENRKVSYIGIQKTGPLDVPYGQAERWLDLPTNPNGRRNAEILKPYYNGDDVTNRCRNYWIIDFPLGLSVSQAAQFEAPFDFLRAASYAPDHRSPTVNFAQYRRSTKGQNPSWWEPHRPRPALRETIQKLRRYIATPETAQHRLFCWLQYPVLPDKNLVVIAKEDDTTFGILHAHFHEIWALKLGTSLEDRPRYTATTTFATYPFPEGLTPNIPASEYEDDPHAQAIAAAARQLDRLRNNWLNPPDLVRIEPEVVPGYPDRILPKDAGAEKILKTRTLTNLYNERPAWLDNAHRDLDAAVAAAYGWPADIGDEEALARLLALNLERAAAGR